MSDDTPAILIRNAMRIATFDDHQREWPNGDVLIIGNRIAAVGQGLHAPAGARVIDASSCVVLPGFVNTHHHLCQTLTRAVPHAQNAELFEWLTNLYEIWRGFTPDLAYVAALIGLGELLLTGCTLTTDHTYLFPRNTDGRMIDALIRAAKDLGIRFHPTRGCMTLGKSHGGLPPDDVCQDHETILEDCDRLAATYHNGAPDAMLKIALAPCAPFNVEERTMHDLAALARQRGLRLHTHMCETLDEEKWCAERYNMRPLEWAESIGWLGDDVWLAHVVHVNDQEIQRLADTGTGVAHCPSSNMRLGSGIPPVVKMVEAGVAVGLGVDGSSSNDTGDMLGELRQCLLLQRVANGAAAIDARTVLRMATRGGARILGHDLAGRIEPGAVADVVLFNVERIGYAGALHDPVAALLFAGDSHIVEYSIVNGRVVVEKGALTGVSEAHIVAAAKEAAGELIARSGIPPITLPTSS